MNEFVRQYWYWLLILWPLLGWIRFVLIYRKHSKAFTSKGKPISFGVVDLIHAAIWPFFESPF